MLASVRVETLGPRPFMPLVSQVQFYARWNMTREWLPVIVIINYRRSMIMSLAPLWVAYCYCGHSSLLWRPFDLHEGITKNSWILPYPFSPPHPSFLILERRFKTTECGKNTWVLAPVWPFVIRWLLVKLCKSAFKSEISNLWLLGLEVWRTLD
jgi:hypothetical protein